MPIAKIIKDEPHETYILYADSLPEHLICSGKGFSFCVVHRSAHHPFHSRCGGPAACRGSGECHLRNRLRTCIRRYHRRGRPGLVAKGKVHPGQAEGYLLHNVRQPRNQVERVRLYRFQQGIRVRSLSIRTQRIPVLRI